MSKQRRRSPLLSLLFAPFVKCNGRAAASPAVVYQTPVSRPINDDHDAWHSYWTAQSQPWRTEPEIDLKRQNELSARRSLVLDVEKGVYPFKGMKLSRADVEWLLAIHENGRGPVSWSDSNQRKREGLHLGGADLRGIDLSNLPLACLQGEVSSESKGKGLFQVLDGVDLERASLAHAHLENANLIGANLKKAYFFDAHLEGAKLLLAQLDGAHFSDAHLEEANLWNASLRGADFSNAHLENAKLVGTNLERTNFYRAHLEEADLAAAVLSDEKQVGPQLADVYWDRANLAVVEWSQVKILGEEWAAYQKHDPDGTPDELLRGTRNARLNRYERAVRANRQLSIVLQAQGLNEDSARFAYRAQVLQKTAFRYKILISGISFKQRVQTFGAWLFSWFLFLIAGYGYRPSRSFLAYFLVISGFATAYYLLGHAVGPSLSPLGAFVFSMTSFHGRGFFPGKNISLDDPLTVLAAFEALVGLIIEVTFIATLTQRFFNR